VSRRSPLERVEVETGTPADRAVIWLHGLGADGHDFEPIVPWLPLDPGHRVRFVFPHAPPRPVTLNAGLIMRAWYDIRSLGERHDEDEAGIRESAGLVAALIDEQVGLGIRPDRIVLAGFSQGGALALSVALRCPSRLAGVVALSAYLVLGHSLAAERSPANAGIPVFQAHGTHDPMVPLVAGEQTRDALRALGYTVDWRTYPMGHEVRPEEIQDIGAALDRMLRA